MKQIKTSVETDKKELEKEASLRPGSLREYIGQSAIKARMQLTVDSAKKRNEPLDHILLFGPPGLGKTTLAFISWLKEQTSLKAILCGHLHMFWTEDFSPTAVQYVVGGACNGQGYHIKFKK